MGSKEDQDRYIFSNPMLLSENLLDMVGKQIAQLPNDDQKRIADLLSRLQSMRAHYEEHILEYPMGFSPIENIFGRWVNGEINPTEAEKLASEKPVSSTLSHVCVRALCAFAIRLARRGVLRRAVQLHRLLEVSLQAAPDSVESIRMRWRVDFDWIETAYIALLNVPDGRIYRSAMEAGARLVKAAEDSGDTASQGEVLHRLGALNGDPYYSGRSSVNYELQMQQWHQRLYDELGPEIAIIPAKELEMPLPIDALKTAESYYRQAIPLQEGNGKGLSLKALSETLEWEQVVSKKPVDQEELRKICEQALVFLDVDAEPDARLTVIATLNRLGSHIDVKEVLKSFHKSPDEMIRMQGALKTILFVDKAVEILGEKTPVQALELLRDKKSLFDVYGDETQRRNRWTSELRLITNSVSQELPVNLPAGGMQAVVKGLYERSNNEHWDISKLSAGLVGLAVKSSNWNEESSGLIQLNEARKIAPVFAKDYGDALAFLNGILNQNLGADAVASGDYARAVEAYSIALRQFLDMNQRDTVMNLLARIEDLTSRQGPDVGRQIVMGLSPLIPALETKLGEPAALKIQSICKRTIAGIQGSINPEIPFILLQLAKGQRFAKALYSGSRYAWQGDAAGRAFLQQIDEARRAPIPASDNTGVLLTEDQLLLCYVIRNIGKSPGGAAERLANLEKTYDEYLQGRLLAGAGSDEVLYFSSRDIQSAIDQRTVILDYYLGATSKGFVGVLVVLLTKDDMKMSLINHDFPDSLVQMSDSKWEIEINPQGMIIEGIRSEIQKIPEKKSDFVTQAGAELLDKYLMGYLGPFVEDLERLRKEGKDHLCIIPHGPLHYLPFHLLGKQGKLLADNWKVTYLPNLHLLASNRGAPSIRRFREKTISAFGLSFENNISFHLDPLPEAKEESKTIAKVFGVEPVEEEDATESNFVRALKDSRYVHLATHGMQNIYAPAFHCVFLTPDTKSDGMLFAHELLSQDFRGLEVLTLSACETALGRFDVSDNLRGLPASLLLAGVSTIVGTLWKVETHCAERFFERFYQELKAGASRLDAFASAQSETRKNYPLYQNWGAFYFIGDWS
jgi:hypothetical protein